MEKLNFRNRRRKNTYIADERLSQRAISPVSYTHLDGKYNITNQFGGTLYEYIGKNKALDLMYYVDELNLKYGGEGTKLYSTANTEIKKLCVQNGLHLLDASVRHLGTDKNYVVLENLYAELKDKVDFYFDTPVDSVLQNGDGYIIKTAKGDYECDKCIISAGRSGSKWMEKVCSELNIPTKSNPVDIGVRVELPAEVFSHLTDELYESKIVYRTAKFEDLVRTFCMNPHGVVVNENTNGIVTVNGHSYDCLLYTSSPLSIERAVLPFSHTIEIDNLSTDCYYELQFDINNINVIMIDSSELEVKVNITLCAIAFSSFDESFVSDIVTAPLDFEQLHKLPGIVGYYAAADTPVWDIAKKYRTTVKSIMDLNEINGDTVHKGDKLLLLKMVEGI